VEKKYGGVGVTRKERKRVSRDSPLQRNSPAGLINNFYIFSSQNFHFSFTPAAFRPWAKKEDATQTKMFGARLCSAFLLLSVSSKNYSWEFESRAISGIALLFRPCGKTAEVEKHRQLLKHTRGLILKYCFCN